ncbi:ATP-binding response regulator [Cohaesibacter celericrescens]|uniref:histidine kinase n=1 Tax=Cohaesibacter celericrescens TaxID=2067669 RepID=A0A2N5XU83_9HYPH|nr:ATP-binding protein [Cohaesibacter celericrescens]PLW78076.1 hypothetical protein C0081_06390 [Cohaesibacter celericrescens]
MKLNSNEIAENTQKTDRFRHDLRTHLGAIVSLTDLIRQTPSPQDCAPLLDALHLAADNAMAIVEGGTDLQSPLGHQPEQLLRLLGNFDQLAKGLAQAHNTRFELHISDELRDQAPAIPEPTYLHRVLMLLLDNSIKYADGAPIQLSAAVKYHKTQSQIELIFSDTGAGFGDQDPMLLFEPYHRGKAEPSIAGSGLGLWSVRNIISVLGGKIQAQENTPSGAKITIDLPFETEQTAPDGPSAKEQASTSKPLHILLVDDNQTNHLILGEMLEAMDCECLHASSGHQALQLLRQTRPDLAIIDIRMAQMDGWELATRIRNTDSYGDFPLIALSSDPIPAQIAPFDDWVQRPLAPARLYQLLGQTKAN